MSNINGILKHYEDEIDEIKNNLNYPEIKMKTINDNLRKLKGQIEDIFDNVINSIGRGLVDAPYNGWHGQSLREMKEVYEAICTKLRETYAIVLKSLGE